MPDILENTETVSKAGLFDWALANCQDVSRESLTTGLEIVDILRELEADPQTCAAGFACSLGQHLETNRDALATEYGDQVVALSESALRISQLSRQLTRDDNAPSPVNEERFRAMLISMVDDPRVVLISLCWQLHLMRNCKQSDPGFKTRQSKLTRDVYAPLANRLGVWQLKWELEDLSFRYSHPKTYHNLAVALEEKRHQREAYICALIDEIHQLLDGAGIDAVVKGRPKHIYSIWKKMQGKSLEFKQLWDIRGVRILVENIEDCYAALGLIHGRWTHVATEYKDYVATPKNNGYRSIHTIIHGADEKAVEVQIRTHAMHRESEIGLAAHWRYKEGARGEMDIDNKVIWLRSLLEWRDEILESPTVRESLAVASRQQRIYVFTPKGAVIDLPVGATALDFAYTIHTEVGHRTRGARVNGKMVPLGHRLQTADQVSIHTQKSGGPSRDWLRKDNPYIRTSRAHNRIMQWFKREDFSQYVATGRQMLERELGRLGLESLSYEKIYAHTPFQSMEDLLAAIGAGDFKLSRALAPFRHPPDAQVETLTRRRVTRSSHGPPSGFIIQGVGNLLSHPAKCCQPAPGDAIIGFITRGKGVSIHRSDCSNITKLETAQKNRLVEVEWGDHENSTYTVVVHVVAFQRSGLLHDLTEILKSSSVDVSKVNMETDSEHISRLELRLELAADTRPELLIGQLKSVKNVLDVYRG